jgi:hypothetical protein
MYLNYTRKNVATEVNRRSANIIMKAMSYTKRASAEAINAFMRREVVHSEVVKYPKAGKSGKARIHQAKAPKVTRHATLAAYKIYNYWLKKRGEKPIGGKEMGYRVKLFIDAIVRSTANITAGWFPALNTYKKSMKQFSGVKPPNNPKGTASKGGAILAKPGIIIRSYFYNTAYPQSRADKRTKTPSDIAGPPLDIALEMERQDMKGWLEDQMQKTGDKVFK